jgi:hypothetical protein
MVDTYERPGALGTWIQDLLSQVDDTFCTAVEMH